MPAIEEHVENEAFDSAKDGLDFLEVRSRVPGIQRKDSFTHDHPKTNPLLCFLGQEQFAIVVLD